MENKGENPEEYLRDNAIHSGFMVSIHRNKDVNKALELARTQEREKLIREIEEKVKALDKTAGVFPGTTFTVYVSHESAIEILNNLKKEKGE